MTSTDKLSPMNKLKQNKKIPEIKKLLNVTKYQVSKEDKSMNKYLYIFLVDTLIFHE